MRAARVAPLKHNIKVFKFTQTAIKDFEKVETCPFRWRSQWVEGKIPFKSNEDMDKGKYFEQLFIGGSAKENDIITDLPRLKDGNKSVDQLRIESQVERAKRLFSPDDPEYLGLTITDTQLKLKDPRGREGTIDIVALDEEGATWVIDVKLTKDLSSNRTQYSWGNDWVELDLLQQLHYEDLYFHEYKFRPRMGLLVFDYSPSKRVEFGEIRISAKRRVEKDIRFTAAEEAFALYEKNGWIKTPNVKECEGCPLSCKERELGTKLIKKVINY